MRSIDLLIFQFQGLNWTGCACSDCEQLGGGRGVGRGQTTAVAVGKRRGLIQAFRPNCKVQGKKIGKRVLEDGNQRTGTSSYTKFS